MKLLESSDLDELQKICTHMRRMIMAIEDGMRYLHGRVQAVEKMIRVLDFRLLMDDRREEDDN